MSDILAQTIQDIVDANHILANEGVLDGFGHVSARHPHHPDRFLISRSRSPALVARDDIVELDLDGEPLEPLTVGLYVERVIHGAFFRARPDVMAVSHHHAASVMPFCQTGVPIVPVFHIGAVIGETVPFWDSRDEFGDTNMLVETLDQAHSLARACGENWSVLLRRHGACNLGRSVREVVFRSVHLKQNAELQFQSQALGVVSPLTSTEIALAAQLNLGALVQTRLWDYWKGRLAA